VNHVERNAQSRTVSKDVVAVSLSGRSVEGCVMVGKERNHGRSGRILLQ